VELLELLLCNVYVLVELLYIWMYIWQDDDDDVVVLVLGMCMMMMLCRFRRVGFGEF
jgi:hypothetical protein